MAGTILTTIGLSKLAAATPQNQLNITHIAVGDGNGGFPTLSPTMTALTNEVWRGDSSVPVRSQDQENVIFFEVNIPPEDGGFTLREIAIFDNSGAMIAIGHTGEVVKPEPTEETAFSLTARIFIALENATQVSLIYQDTNKTHHNTLTNRDASNSHPATAIQSSDGRNVEQRLNDLPSEVATVVTAEADRAEVAADAAMISGSVYETTAAGITATTTGDYFSVVSPISENYIDLYLNDNGSAVLQKSYPSSDLITNILNKDDETHAASSSLVQKATTVKFSSIFQQGGTVQQGEELSFTYFTGGYINDAGEVYKFSPYSYTDFIPVVQNKQYEINNFMEGDAGLAFYDEKKSFISFVTGAELDSTNGIITSPDESFFMRVSFSTNRFLVVKANELIEYEKNNFEKNTVTPELIFGGSLKNNSLINSTSYLSYYINSTGESVSFTDSVSHTNYLPVLPNSAYRVKARLQDDLHFAFYDHNFKFISSLDDSVLTDDINSITTPSDCYFIRSSFVTSEGFNLFAGQDLIQYSALERLNQKASYDLDPVLFIKEEGFYLNGSGGKISNAGFNYFEINVKQGDLILVNGFVTGDARLHNANNIIFPDSNNTSYAYFSDWVFIKSDSVLKVSYIKSRPFSIYKSRSFERVYENFENKVYENIDTTAFNTVGKYLNLDGTIKSQSAFSLVELPVKAGESYQILGYVQDNARLHDANGVIYPPEQASSSYPLKDDVYILEDGILNISYLTIKDFHVKKMTFLEDIPEMVDLKVEKAVDGYSVLGAKDHFRTFHRSILSLGDSLTSGAYYNESGSQGSIEECYPYYLNLMSKWVVTNAGFSGRAPLQIWQENIQDFNGSDYDGVILWLGTNNGLTDTIANDTESGDYLTYADTETGRYCSIVEKLLSENPDLKLYFMTVYATEGSLSVTNSVISQIADRYNGYLIESNPDGVLFPAPEIHKFNAVHFDKIGNERTANVFYRSILNVISENIQDYDAVLYGSRTTQVFDN